MITVQPGEGLVLEATFTSDGEVAAPTEPVEVRIKPASGEYGTAVEATPQGGGVYEAETTAPEAPGLYIARFSSAAPLPGIRLVTFQVSED